MIGPGAAGTARAEPEKRKSAAGIRSEMKENERGVFI
jgi:hypothetical protein